MGFSKPRIGRPSGRGGSRCSQAASWTRHAGGPSVLICRVHVYVPSRVHAIMRKCCGRPTSPEDGLRAAQYAGRYSPFHLCRYANISSYIFAFIIPRFSRAVSRNFAKQVLSGRKWFGHRAKIRRPSNTKCEGRSLFVRAASLPRMGTAG